jgi:hypothetical protein
MNLPSPDQRAQVAAIDLALHLSSSNNENSEIHDDNSLAQLAQAAVAATLDGNSSVPVDLALLLPSNSSKEINKIIDDDKEEHPIRERVTFNLPAFHARWIKQETLQDRCRLIATALTYSVRDDRGSKHLVHLDLGCATLRMKASDCSIECAGLLQGMERHPHPGLEHQERIFRGYHKARGIPQRSLLGFVGHLGPIAHQTVRRPRLSPTARTTKFYHVTAGIDTAKILSYCAIAEGIDRVNIFMCCAKTCNISLRYR